MKLALFAYLGYPHLFIKEEEHLTPVCLSGSGCSCELFQFETLCELDIEVSCNPVHFSNPRGFKLKRHIQASEFLRGRRVHVQRGQQCGLSGALERMRISGHCDQGDYLSLEGMR